MEKDCVLHVGMQWVGSNSTQMKLPLPHRVVLNLPRNKIMACDAKPPLVGRVC